MVHFRISSHHFQDNNNNYDNNDDDDHNVNGFGGVIGSILLGGVPTELNRIMLL